MDYQAAAAAAKRRVDEACRPIKQGGKMNIVYTIDVYSKEMQVLLSEIEVPPEKATEMANILGLNANDREEFARGIGVYQLTKKQAHQIELLVGKTFYSDDVTLQISGGEI
ncbi:TPA: hypothetical protein QIT10_001954 [Enterobacter bugandensis]|nr:hypothetical protein [Enterobacter bugandensis]HDV8502320.1 hypothetical protein [Enterobacter bugandensis]HDV8502333.1 hypothetical protein [Enterobacter bugandensis]HDV8502346.1 hypothetical protein [Enterobacter bugandensis]HDV8502360.1 hypothetical protein [Enterobacter bugandensis]